MLAESQFLNSTSVIRGRLQLTLSGLQAGFVDSVADLSLEGLGAVILVASQDISHGLVSVTMSSLGRMM